MTICLCDSLNMAHQTVVLPAFLRHTTKGKFTRVVHFPIQNSLLHMSQRLEYSTKEPQTLKITRDNIFSEANRDRCKNKLQSVQPVRKLSWVKNKELKYAGVLVPMCIVQGEPSILFTLRSTKLESHRGEVSFPGGKRDDDDKHIIDTALREAEEEIGLDRTQVEVWGSLVPVPSRNFDSAVIPVLAYCGDINTSSLQPNHHEVSEIFTRTISSLCHNENTRYTSFRTGNGYTLPVYLGGDHRIWGLSAIVLHQTLTAVAPGLYTFSFPQHRR